MRKHEAIETDIVAYSGRVQAVDAVAAELAAERYHDIKRIAARQHNVARLWDFLRQMVAARRERLLVNLELQKVFQDLLYLMDWMEEMKVPAGGVWWGLEDWDCGGQSSHAGWVSGAGPCLWLRGAKRTGPGRPGLTFSWEVTDEKNTDPPTDRTAGGCGTCEGSGAGLCPGGVCTASLRKCGCSRAQSRWKSRPRESQGEGVAGRRSSRAEAPGLGSAACQHERDQWDHKDGAGAGQ